MTRTFRTFVMFAATAALLVSALFAARAAAQSPGAPDAGTVARIATFTLADSELISGTTFNTAAPLTLAGGADASNVANWNAADVFILADVGSNATLTATVQFSPDASLWADSQFDYINGSGAVAQGTHQRVFTADGASLLRVPVAGSFTRMELTADGIVTATVTATYRNN